MSARGLELVSCSASNFSIDGRQTPLVFWQLPTSYSYIAWFVVDDSQHIEEQSQA